MQERTTRQRITDHLREEEATASELAGRFGVPTPQVYEHVRHVARTLEGEELLVAPPECRDCGFAAFDRPASDPSRCPECRSETVEESTFKIE